VTDHDRLGSLHIRIVKRALIIVPVIVVLCAAAALGGYSAGLSRGSDLEAARAEGTTDGEREGSASGSREGYRRGFRAGRRAGYRKAYDEGLEAAPEPAVERDCGNLVESGAGTYAVKARGPDCDLARTVARRWETECATGGDGSCRVSAGYDCTYRDVGYELGYITCTSGPAQVRFETGA
jgi:hypothetical protein